jgi:YHS domain-containing protein
MKTSVLMSLLIVMVAGCSNKTPEVYCSSSGAIGGYDPVAYFTQNKPVKGSQEFSYRWKDANWLFSSRQNRDLFTSNPEKYAPQYGGWCAYGCSKGRKATTDPNAWTIVDGKLYLNHSIDVKGLWMKNQKESIEAADKNWPGIRNK